MNASTAEQNRTGEFALSEFLYPACHEPNEFLRTVRTEYISRYQSKFGLPEMTMGLVRLNTRRSIEIGRAFDLLPLDQRHDPATLHSYTQCGVEIAAQFDFLKHEGEINFEFFSDASVQYPNSKVMMQDLAANKRLKVFTGGEDHPVFGMVSSDDDGITLNHKFRAVHDVFGHAVEGHQFGPCGEENAFAQHSAMFSDEALPAMATDLRGQNSWVNFGPHMFDDLGWKGDARHPNHVKFVNREYAQQKVALLPSQFCSRYSFQA